MDHRGVLFSVAVLLFVLLLAAGFGVHYWWEERMQERSHPSVPTELRQALFREAILLGTLLERLASEVAMEKELPSSIRIITRRVMLDRIENHGLRHDLKPWQLDLLLAPDGQWTAEQKEKALGAWESFAVLNWVLGLGELRGLTLQPEYSLEAVNALCTLPDSQQLRVLPAWDIRPARDAASKFFNRCWAELLARKEVPGAEDADVNRALDARESIASEGYLRDYLIGARTIPELETPLIWILAQRAYRRWELLSLLVPILSEEQSVARIRTFLAQFFTSSEKIASEPMA